MGDCIMMLRYLPELRACGVEFVTVYCDPALRRVVESMSAADRVVATEEQAGAIDFDVHCPMMSLPWTFGTRLDTIPGRNPYLSVPERMLAPCRERLRGPAPKVGLAWEGSRTLEDDARRSVPIEQFAPLLVYGRSAKPGVDLGTRGSLADIGQTIAENFGVRLDHGMSFLPEI